MEHCELKYDHNDRTLAPCDAFCQVCHEYSRSWKRGTSACTLHCLCSGHPGQDVVCGPLRGSGAECRDKTHSTLPASSAGQGTVCPSMGREVAPVVAYSCAKALPWKTLDDVSHRPCTVRTCSTDTRALCSHFPLFQHTEKFDVRHWHLGLETARFLTSKLSTPL